MSDRVLLPLTDGRWLVLTPDAFNNALLHGTRLMAPDEQQIQKHNERWLTVNDIAWQTGISPDFWYDAIMVGKCPSRGIGHTVRIPASFLDEIAEKLIRLSNPHSLKHFLVVTDGTNTR